MNVYWYTSVTEFPDVLVKFCAQTCDLYPFSSLAYFEGYERHVLKRGSSRPAYLVVFNDGNPLALLPLMKTYYWGLSAAFSLTNYYFFRFDLYLSNNALENKCLLERVYNSIRAELDQFQVCHFVPVHEKDVNLRAFLNWIKKHGWLVDNYDHSVNWACNIYSISEYFDKLPSRLKNTLLRSGKKIESKGGRAVILSNPEEIKQCINDYWVVYNKSWKIAEPYPIFIEKVVQDLARSHKCMLGLLYMESKPVSSQLWFVDGHVAYIFKLAYDPDYHKYSVGSYLTWKMLEHSVENYQIDTVDFLNGDDAYKKDWMDRSFEVNGFFCINKGRLIGRVLSLTYRIRRWFRTPKYSAVD